MVHSDSSSNLVFFDLETKRSAAEVGGWSRIHALGLSLAVTYSERDGFLTYFRDDVPNLVRYLQNADAVVGFNHTRFDYKVLTPYTKENLHDLNNIDMHQEIYDLTRRRISLDNLASESLGRNKTGDGLEAIQWFKEGRLDLIEEYCRADVAITRDLYYFGREKGHVYYLDRGERWRVSVDW